MQRYRLLISLSLGLGTTLVLLGLLIIMPLPQARAATITVTNTNDAGVGSLRQAIADAGLGDTIDFSLTYPSTIALTSGELVINKSITVAGPGAHQLSISGNDASRVFNITGGNVTIVDLTVTRGDVGDFSGGGIQIEGTSTAVTLINVTVFSNTAQAGGGVYSWSGNVILSGCQILSNSVSAYGGGVFVSSGGMTLDGGRILSNTADWYGGGVYVSNANAIFTQTGASTIDHNFAAHYGGGVYVGNGSATLSDGGIISNVAGLSGGGVFVDGGSAILDGVHIIDNSASDGGGVKIWSGSVILGAGQIVSNTATTFSGGGVHIYLDSAVFTQTGFSTIAYNSANYCGGGVYVSFGKAVLSGGEIKANTAIGMSDWQGGGGVYVYSGNAVLGGVQVISNTANNNGGGLYVGWGTATLGGGQIVSNTATSGGGVYIETSTGAFTQTGDSIIAHNAVSQNGGGTYVKSGTAILSGGDIHSNIAITGSALYNSRGAINVTAAVTITGDVYQSDGTFNSSNDPLRIEGSLALAGGTFQAPTGTFTLTDLFVHTGGTYRQTQGVNSSADVSFPKAGGVIVNAKGIDLGSTEVELTAGANCASVTPGETVQHCYLITPTNSTAVSATVTFFYLSDEAGVHACAAMEAYRWNGTWDNVLVRDVDYGIDGRMCSNDPKSIQVEGVTTFSPFVLREADPEITVTPASLSLGSQDVDAGPTLSQTVVITNDGTADLHVTSISLTGADAAHFQTDGGASPVTLTQGTTHTVQISFNPSTTGAKSANLTIQSDDSDEPTVNVALNGSGVRRVYLPLVIRGS